MGTLFLWQNQVGYLHLEGAYKYPGGKHSYVVHNKVTIWVALCIKQGRPYS